MHSHDVKTVIMAITRRSCRYPLFSLQWYFWGPTKPHWQVSRVYTIFSSVHGQIIYFLLHWCEENNVKIKPYKYRITCKYVSLLWKNVHHQLCNPNNPVVILRSRWSLHYLAIVSIEGVVLFELPIMAHFFVITNTL